MSNKTDLQALNANYEVLIEELRGKAVGGGTGGGVGTCTVILNYPAQLRDVYYTVLEDGELTYARKSLGTGVYSATLENVVCGSFFIVRSGTIYSPIATITGGGEFINMAITSFQGYAATDMKGGTMIVDMIDDD